MSDYPSVTALMQRVVKEARNGVPPKAVAHILGMEYGTFMAQLGRRSNHKLDADLLLPLMEITDSYAPLHLLAEAMGGFFVPMPDVMHPGHTVQRQCMASVKKFGDLMQRVAGALEDGTIDEDERREIVRCGYEAQIAILALLRVVEDAAEQGAKNKGLRSDAADRRPQLPKELRDDGTTLCQSPSGCQHLPCPPRR